MLNLFKKISNILQISERKKIIKLFALIFIIGILEVAGVASILPFMELASKPMAIENSTLLRSIYEYFGFGSHREMLVVFGIFIFLVIALTNALGIFMAWFEYKISWDIAHNFGVRLLIKYIKKPYSFYLNKNTSTIQTYVISEVNSIANGIILPLLNLISKSFIALIIFMLLCYVDVVVALIMFGSLGSCYLIIYYSRKKFLKRIGLDRMNMNILRYKSLSELLSGIKTITVYNEEGLFYKRFEKASRAFCDVQPKFNIIHSGPRFLIEFLAFGSILFITIYLFVTKGNIQNSIPRLSLYAVAGYRMLPALQKTFAALTKIRHNLPILDNLYEELIDADDKTLNLKKTEFFLPFEKKITLKNLDFAYEENQEMLFKDFNMSIIKGTRIAIIGSTGSGKTTIVDLITGLLTPQRGSIRIDELDLTRDNFKSWQNQIAYVPQEIFLFDDSILKNIVLGDNEEDLNMQKLIEVTKIADIYDFINEELPEKFQTIIGERGVRLSGGQRQRIGLARALYRSPSLLILDEATSALDNITEKNIIDSLQKLPQEMTLIIVAHRLSTIKYADLIYVLENGKIVDLGNYETLFKKNIAFKNLVELS